MCASDLIGDILSVIARVGTPGNAAHFDLKLAKKARKKQAQSSEGEDCGGGQKYVSYTLCLSRFLCHAHDCTICHIDKKPVILNPSFLFCQNME